MQDFLPGMIAVLIVIGTLLNMVESKIGVVPHRPGAPDYTLTGLFASTTPQDKYNDETVSPAVISE